MEQTWSRKRHPGGGGHINASALVMVCNPKAIDLKQGLGGAKGHSGSVKESEKQKRMIKWYRHG